MTKKLLSLLSILALCAAVSASSNAQETRLGADLGDIDPGLAKQIARDKQLLGIWKDHVRALTRERDEAYQRIEELKSTRSAELPPEPIQDTAALEAAMQEKEAALRQSEDLRSQVTALKTQINKLEIQGAHQQFAVEVRPETPAQNPASQKFYADLSKNYMLQQQTIKNLRIEAARIQKENRENLDLKLQAEGAAQEFKNQAAELEPLRQEAERSAKQSTEAKLKLDSLEAKHSGLETSYEKVTAENKQIWTENQKLASDNKNLSGRIQVEIERSRENESRLKDVLADLAEARKEAEETNQALKNQIDSLKTRLKANASDVQNLKENFSTLLEPLVSSFDERK